MNKTRIALLGSSILFIGILSGYGYAKHSKAHAYLGDFLDSLNAPEESEATSTDALTLVPPPVKSISVKKAPVKKTSKATKSPKQKSTKEDAPAASSTPLVASSSSVSPVSEAACDWKTFGLPSEEILINEIAWMGSEDDANAEWIELKNVSGYDMDLQGFELRSHDKKIKIALTPKILKPGELYLLERDTDDAVPEIAADQIYSGAISNSGGSLKLFGRGCRLVDEVDATGKWPSGNSGTKQTMERRVGIGGWQTSLNPGGTPRSQNAIPSLALNPGGAPTSPPTDTSGDIPLADSGETETASSSRILIYKIQITGTATDDDRITLYNPNPDSVDITGWKLRKRTKSGSESSVKVLAGEITGRGTYVWANAKHTDGADATSTQTLSSDNSVGLLDGSDILIDAIAWGSGHVNPYSEGSAYPANPVVGQVLARKFSGDTILDTDNNAEDFEIR